MPDFAGQAEKTFNGTPGRASMGYIENGTSLRTWFPAKFTIRTRIAGSHICNPKLCKPRQMLSQRAVRPFKRRRMTRIKPPKLLLDVAKCPSHNRRRKCGFAPEIAGVQTCLRVWWWLCELGQARNRAALSKSVRYTRGQVCAPVFRAPPSIDCGFLRDW